MVDSHVCSKKKKNFQKAVFNVTRKLLAEAKQAAAHIPADEREVFISSINEVLTYCRMQTDAAKKAAAAKSGAGGGGGNKSPVVSPREEPEKKSKPSTNTVGKAGGAAATAAAAAATSSPAPAPAASIGKAAGAKVASAGQTPTAPPREAPLPSSQKAATVGGTGTAKMNNSEVMLRKGSVLVAQKGAATVSGAPIAAGAGPKKGAAAAGAKGPSLNEKERLVAALAAKKVQTKVGKLQKEGGGKSLLGRKTWKERLFDLSESSLEYYEKSNTNEKPLGTISLHDVTSARSCTVAGKVYCFEVVTTERNLQIQVRKKRVLLVVFVHKHLINRLRATWRRKNGSERFKITLTG